MEKIYLIQNSWLEWLASYRNESLDHFFRFLNFFDTNYFYFLLIPVIWVGFSWRWGIRLFFFFIIAGFLSYFCKALFGQPRPYVYLPYIELIPLRSFGFPSGGAQNSLILGGLLIYYWRKKGGVILGLSYFLLISFSRLYLGVHYFSDVLGGWLLGALLLFLFLRYGENLENWLRGKSYPSLMAISILVPMIGIILIPSLKVIFLMIGTIVVGLSGLAASYWHLHLQPAKNIREGIQRGVIVILGGVILLLLEMIILDKKVQSFIMPIFLGLWLTIGSSLACLALVPKTARDGGTKERKRKINRW